jgi:hypothetical protein
VLRKTHTEFVSEKVEELEPLVGQTHSIPFFSQKEVGRGGGGGEQNEHLSVFNKNMYIFIQNCFHTNITTQV